MIVVLKLLLQNLTFTVSAISMARHDLVVPVFRLDGRDCEVATPLATQCATQPPSEFISDLDIYTRLLTSYINPYSTTWLAVCRSSNKISILVPLRVTAL